MPKPSYAPNLRAGLLCGLIGVGLIVAPASVTEPIRTTVRDLARPGQAALRLAGKQCRRTVRSWVDVEGRLHQIPELESEIAAWRLRCRRLQNANIKLNKKLETVSEYGPDRSRAESSEPLIEPELVQARVLGEETADKWRSGSLIDRGDSGGIAETAFVLEDTRPLIDRGRDGGLDSGLPVYAGRRVVGRIARVGRWTSTVVPLTDKSFHSYARLARKTERGIVTGPVGILEGQDAPLCRLKFVGSTEPVSVGDEVVTTGRDGALPEFMYLGKVVEAELSPGAAHWEILVEPAVTLDEVHTVQVLRRTVNPARMLGH